MDADQSPAPRLPRGVALRVVRPDDGEQSDRCRLLCVLGAIVLIIGVALALPLASASAGRDGGVRAIGARRLGRSTL